ncbi:hypothetical protein V8B97DRAFT_1872613, partial [Scleroderma yunnanense]
IRTPPTDLLKILTNIQPIPLLLQHLLQNFTICMASLPIVHPLHCFMKKAAKRDIIHHKTAIHCLLHSLSLHSEKIETISLHPLTPQSLTPLAIEIAATKEALKEDFQCCTNHIMVFMDSLCHNGLVGAVASLFVDHSHIATLHFHLGNAKEHTNPSHPSSSSKEK